MPDDLLQRLVLHGGIIPGAVSLSLLGLFWWMHRRKSDVPRDEGEPAGDGPRWLLPLLLAGGLVAADYVVKVRFDLWPTDNTMRAAHAAILLGLFGFMEGLVRLPAWGVALARAATFGGVAWMLCEGYAPQTISNADLWGIVAASGLIGSLIAHAADCGTTTTPGWAGMLAWVIAIGAVQPMLHLAGFSSGSMALTGVMAVLTSALIVSVVVRDFSPARGGASVLTGLLLAGVLGAGVQSEPKSVPALLLMAALPLVFVLAAGGAKRTLLARAVGVGLVVGSIGAILHFGSPGGDGPAEDDPYADYYG